MPALKIANVDRFRIVAHHAFEDDMVAHLGVLSPLLARSAGDAGLRAMIRLGIARVGEYGVTLRGPVRLYLELMVLLGSYFDNDPQYPWAAEILVEHDADDPMRSAKRLQIRAIEYLDEIEGPDGAHLLRALDYLRGMARRSRCEPSSVQVVLCERRFMADMLRRITEVHPERAAFVGRSGLEALIYSGIVDARFHGIATPYGTALLIALMLGLGHGCTEDPQHTWIAETLSDPNLTGPEPRVLALEARSLDWLERVERDWAGEQSI